MQLFLLCKTNTAQAALPPAARGGAPSTRWPHTHRGREWRHGAVPGGCDTVGDAVALASFSDNRASVRRDGLGVLNH